MEILVLMNSIRELFSPARLSLSEWSGPEEIEANKYWLKRLLGSMIHLAMRDGMTKLSLGVDRQDGNAWMKFFGPHWCDPPTWWDMVPPGSDCFPMILQICISLAQLESTLPLKGTIEARKGGIIVHLHVEITEIHSIDLSWDSKYALGRDAATASINC